MRTHILISSFVAVTTALSSGCSIPTENDDMFTGSHWELYGYKDANLAQIQPLTDTLVFGAQPYYEYNHAATSYNLFSTNNGNQSMRLQLKDTRFGTVTGIVQVASVNSGTILGETFSRPTDGVTWQLWFRKF